MPLIGGRKFFGIFLQTNFLAPFVLVLLLNTLASTSIWENMCTVCGHYYELELQCILFVATTINWENTCTVCGQYNELEVQGTLFVATTMNWK